MVEKLVVSYGTEPVVRRAVLPSPPAAPRGGKATSLGHDFPQHIPLPRPGPCARPAGPGFRSSRSRLPSRAHRDALRDSLLALCPPSVPPSRPAACKNRLKKGLRLLIRDFSLFGIRESPAGFRGRKKRKGRLVGSGLPTAGAHR